MFKFNEYYLIKENFNQLKAMVKSHGTSKDVIDKGFGTPEGVEKGSDDYELLYTLISPDEKHKAEAKNDMYGEIPINPEKEKIMRPFLGMMSKMYYEEKADLSIIRGITNWILANKQTLNRLVIKNNNTQETFNLNNLLDIFKYKTQFNDGRPAYEILTDAIRDKGGADKVKDWINKMPSILKNSFKDQNYYNELAKILNVFDTLSNDNQRLITSSLFGDGEKKGKISRFKSADDFLKAFKIDIKNFQKDYNIDVIKEQVLTTKGAKLVVCDYENNYLIADIWYYPASNSLGEINNWCISYSASHWYDTYMDYESKNKMFFIWNFNEDSSNQYSKMGLCVREDGRVRAFHDKLDNSIGIEVLDEYNINKDFMDIKVSEEEYNFKKKAYLQYSVLKKPFNRWISQDEVPPICNQIIELYNSGDIEDDTMIELWENIFEIRDYSVIDFIVNELFSNCHLKPITKPNSLLETYLHNRYEREESFETFNHDVIKNFYNLYSIGASYMNQKVVEYLKNNEDLNQIYITYFKSVKNEMKNYTNRNNTNLSDNTVIANLADEFMGRDYPLLIDYIIKTEKVYDYIEDVYSLNKNFINNLIEKDYDFTSRDIVGFMENHDYDLSNIKIDNDELDRLLDKFKSTYHRKLQNFENLVSLFNAHDKNLFDVGDDIKHMKFLISNGIELDKMKWHLKVDSESNRYDGAKNFLEDEEYKINIYKEYKKGNIEIDDNKGFYSEHIVKYIFDNNLPIEDNVMFLNSYFYNRRIDAIPTTYIKPILDLTLKHDCKIDAEVAKVALQNNLYDVNKVIDNLDFTEEYSYGKGSEDIIKELLSYDSPYADTIISKLPNLKDYDMDEVGIYIKSVRIINRLLDICEKPKDSMLYYVLKYAYEKDNKEGDVGDNDETLKLIDRLVNMGYKFEFTDRSFYNDSYFIFETLNLYMLKNIIEKRYFNLLKLDREKVCKGVLKQNDVEIYKYFKSILPKKSFKMEQLTTNQNREIIEDILLSDSENFIKIFRALRTPEDIIHYYDRFYPKMSEDEKESIVDSLLSGWGSRDIKGKPEILTHLMKYEDNKKFVYSNWEENKRRKNYTDEIRNWIKNFINPPKVKVKKIKEMFEINFSKFIYKKK